MPIEPEIRKPLPAPWDRLFPLATRIFVWGLLFAALYILRSFFLLLFLTFVFAYIQAHSFDKLERRIGNRPLRVVLVAIALLVVLISEAEL